MSLLIINVLIYGLMCYTDELNQMENILKKTNQMDNKNRKKINNIHPSKIHEINEIDQQYPSHNYSQTF